MITRWIQYYYIVFRAFHSEKEVSARGSVKAAIEREENQACLGYPEREQARQTFSSASGWIIKAAELALKNYKGIRFCS